MIRGRYAVMIALALALSMQAKVWAGPPASGAERFLFDATNRERTARNVPELAWDDALAVSARQHAEQMAQRGALSHQFPGEPGLEARAKNAGANFIALAENVALAPTETDLHTGWMNSPPHRENILDPEMNTIGIAVVERGGELYAVEDFSHAVTALTIEQQEARLEQLVKSRGLELISDHEEARRACASGREPSGGTRAFYFTRFDTASLDDFPDALNRTIASGRYHQAAVGACASDRSDGFGGYRVAVILY
ncbi:MAG: CAP domain-containing protein [Candidatus Acidiferrales bacterium]